MGRAGEEREAQRAVFPDGDQVAGDRHQKGDDQEAVKATHRLYITRLVIQAPVERNLPGHAAHG